MRNTYKILIEKPGWKKSPAKPRRIRKDNIKMNRKETWSKDVTRISLTQYCVQQWARVNTVINLFVP
jgi:hypothetical protein